MRAINYIIIHCTATKSNANIESIRNHFKQLGWKRGGYHYIIDANGHIYNEVCIKYTSNGVRGYNTNAINIAYIGGVSDDGKLIDTRTKLQRRMLRILAKSLIARYPDAKVMGHRDIWGKDQKKWLKQCPCFDVATQL